MKNKILVGLLIMVMLFAFGCITEKKSQTSVQTNNQTNNNQINKTQTNATEPVNVLVGKRNVLAREPGDMVEFSFNSSDVPTDYKLRLNKTGMTYNATKYVENETEAQRLTDLGWFAVYERYYEKLDNRSKPINSIYAGLSFYRNVSKMDCGMNSLIDEFRRTNATEISSAKKLGNRSALFLVSFVDQENPEAGKIYAYEYRFYVGNVFANIEIAGPQNTVNQTDAEKYASIVEAKMVSACNNCETPPTCR